MSDITYTFKKMKILTDPKVTGYENVISKIHWIITFTDGISESISAGVTNLNISNLEGFTPIENITDDIIEKWVIDTEGGDNFIQRLINIQTPILNKKTEESKLNVYYIDPAFIDSKNRIPQIPMGM